VTVAAGLDSSLDAAFGALAAAGGALATGLVAVVRAECRPARGAGAAAEADPAGTVREGWAARAVLVSTGAGSGTSLDGVAGGVEAGAAGCSCRAGGPTATCGSPALESPDPFGVPFVPSSGIWPTTGTFWFVALVLAAFELAIAVFVCEIGPLLPGLLIRTEMTRLPARSCVTVAAELAVCPVAAAC
jgi:hypothetical protein